MTYLDDGDETLEEQEWNLGEISCFAQLGFQPLFQLSLHLHGGRHHENQARKLRDEYWNITLTNKRKGRIWQQKCLYALSVITTSITQVSMWKTVQHYLWVCQKEFADFNPQVSEPGSDMEMPDHVDMLLCKKDGSIFYESDILRRAVNIPHDCQMGGLVLEIFIQNCDGTRYKKDMHIPSLGRTMKLTASRTWENWKFIKLSAKGILTIKKAKTLKVVSLNLSFTNS